jgi:hypothetical protein
MKQSFTFSKQLSFVLSLLLIVSSVFAQKTIVRKYQNSALYAGIEVGSKGVKMSILEIGKNAQKTGAYNSIFDTTINTDFISFTNNTSAATLAALTSLFNTASNDYTVAKENIFTVISSGVKISADKEGKSDIIDNLTQSFKSIIGDGNREVNVVDPLQEAKLSHLGIVPESRRFNTFLIDIGSGNTKGGFFPNGDTKTMKLFKLSWGTKSTANATDKRLEEDKSLENYKKQLGRVLTSAENSEIIYMVNESGGYPMSDYIAFSGGIAWSVATLMYPELANNTVIPTTFEDVLKFSEKLYKDHASFLEPAVKKAIADKNIDKGYATAQVNQVHKVFDQKSLMAGTGLLLKIMRQFNGMYDQKQFFLVKNGQVGWISAYVVEQQEKNVLTKQ